MVSREQHRSAALYEKLQLLRSVTNSRAVNDTSIIIDASNYIKELKGKVERLNQDIASSQNSTGRCKNRHQQLPVVHTTSQSMVTVETLENKGFLVNMLSQTSCPGLLVFVLQAFEDLGLNVLEARASCKDTFRLEAVGGDNVQAVENIDAEVVKQAVFQAIRNWISTST
ncbi:hypothetical protein C5167_014699 [Papaver somniferum]|uniref:Plant bHLH transcription factor ACT-like domain-containing protein n=1 Tax=Papaver somniferum TaxID=3469 RepID=A0A4Y7J7U4_PAPSO|nr:uncharacterized protein LOC113361759 isoform X1 [Papaver somniferum]RZC55838.1 hypothetical protein C5167_014699 [Papaver somniferum]